MSQYALPLDQLRAYSPALPEPDGLDAFWAATIAEARAFDWPATFQAVDAGLTEIRTFDVRFAGFGGAPIRAWLQLPAHASADTRSLPAVVEYVGYGGGRGLPHERILFAAAGYAYLVMDTRGQGSTWSTGDTPDPDSAGGEPAYPGFMTRGVLDPATYYYRRLITDAVRAVDAVRTHPAVDGTRVAVTGGSQGGGLSIAVASLVPDLAAAAPDVPFLCDFPRAITFADAAPYTEIAAYLHVHRDHVERVLHTLAHVDGAILGRRAKAPALFSVALMDRICPPSTVFAAYNAYAGPKEIIEYPFNDHEGGDAFQTARKLPWLAGRLRG